MHCFSSDDNCIVIHELHSNIKLVLNQSMLLRSVPDSWYTISNLGVIVTCPYHEKSITWPIRLIAYLGHLEILSE